MRDKLQKHQNIPCAFSAFVYESLHYHATTILSKSQEEKLLTDIINILRPARMDPLISEMFDADIFRRKMARYEDHCRLRFTIFQGETGHSSCDSCEKPEYDLRDRLMKIAIRSGDTVALETMLAYGMRTDMKCRSMVGYPLETAAIHGNAETVQVLVRHGCPMTFNEHFPIGGVRKNNVLRVAAMSGNWEGFRVWLRGSCLPESHRSQEISDQAATGLQGALGVRDREFFWKGVALCTELGLMNAVVDALNSVIRASDVELLEGIVRRVHIDLSVSTYKTRRLLYTVVYECRRRRADIAQVLLSHALDPNVTFEKNRPLLISSLRRGDPELAAVLIDFGADVNGRYHRESALKLAVILGAGWLVHRLLDAGAKPTYRHKRKSYRVFRDDRVVGNIGRLFGELGWDDETVREAQFDYFVIKEISSKRKALNP